MQSVYSAALLIGLKNVEEQWRLVRVRDTIDRYRQRMREKEGHSKIDPLHVNSSSLKQVDKFTYLGSSVSSTKTDINMQQAWKAIKMLSVIWKTDLTVTMKRSFFQAAVMLILLYGCTKWTLTKRMEKKLDSNYTRMLRAILNRSWKQNPIISSCTATYHPSWKLFKLDEPDMQDTAGEVKSDVFQWSPFHGWAKAGQPTRTYIQQVCVDMGCDLEDLPEVIDDREGWWVRVRDIRAGGMTWCYFLSLIISQITTGLTYMTRLKSKPLPQSGWLVGFYGISTFVGYLMPNPFLCK